MASVGTYLNFARETEEAFAFYKSVFRTEFDGEILRYSGMPPERRALPGAYHDRHYGFPLHDDNELFCRLVLEINQAGLSRSTRSRKRSG